MIMQIYKQLATGILQIVMNFLVVMKNMKCLKLVPFDKFSIRYRARQSHL